MPCRYSFMQFRRAFADRLQNSGDQRREFLAVFRRFPFPPALKNVYPVTAPCVVIHRSVIAFNAVNRYFRPRRLLQECAGDQLRGGSMASRQRRFLSAVKK
ncbi:hypothetical protein [Salmonella enterica]|uniref:hypothetical protein n=1 Tax=Salmonella enterica TaxID=28901 RepID=UPI001C37CC3D|nr:hypothetical protein [Salmonella enterica]